MLTFGQALWLECAELLYPTHCLGCETRGPWFCEPCHAESRLTVPQSFCQLCLKHTGILGATCRLCRQRTGLTKLVSYGRYTALPLKRAIQAIKYDGLSAGIDPLIAIANNRFMAMTYPVNALLVPIPLSRRRYRARGYNQAAVMASALGRTLSRPVSLSLTRTRHTPTQVGLPRDRRAENVRNAFAWLGPTLDVPVILVDDVVTTGATLGSAAEALKAAGAPEVWALTLAVDL